MKRLVPIALGLLLAALAAAASKPAAPPVFDAQLAGRLRLDFDTLSERVALGDDEDLRVVELGRDAHTSHHVVAIRGAEVPHRHDHHDLLVVMLRGYGTLRLGAETRPVGEGSILYIPRGTLHAFTNTAGDPAIGYALYTPAFDGDDRIVEE